MLLTLHESLSGVNSQGGSTVIGVDDKNHSDPNLHKSLGKESTGELKDLFHETSGSLKAEEDAGGIGEAQVSCLQSVKIPQITHTPFGASRVLKNVCDIPPLRRRKHPKFLVRRNGRSQRGPKFNK